MALTKCGECGKQISDKATSCPGCGAPVEISTVSIASKETDVPNPPQSIGKLFIVAVAALPLAYFVYSAIEQKPVEQSYRAKENVNDIELAKMAVLSNLKDPTSAQFSNVRVSSLGVVCGNVNSKNGFGGYSGNQGFRWSSTYIPNRVEFTENCY